ncbi:hypothetical protein JCM19275_2763 [Nonlabens ulvanivorans]|uniref:Uncharacterized protein n=1 Tax=Nonlabens ulvanivorans TaxID=906888 RepID=A0A090WAD6_NONUL|nr:hypothetical protein JCM19275_2763 [Nonlabens ulvanivorans]
MLWSIPLSRKRTYEQAILFTRFAWRPPANSVSKKVSTMAIAVV